MIKTFETFWSCYVCKGITGVLMTSSIVALHLLDQDDQNELQCNFQSFDTVSTGISIM